jgi:uncharacterized protein YoaH (UPF0181 family)
MVFLLRSSGVGTWRVQEALDRVARELMASGVGEGEARVAVQGLRTLADQVRGPQDIMAEV